MTVNKKTRLFALATLLVLLVTIVPAVSAGECGCGCCPCPPPCCRDPRPCTGTPGYWKNHPDAWPVESIWIGTVEYTKAAAITIMEKPVKGDKRITMFKAFVAARLNQEKGCNDCCVECTIAKAEGWLVKHPPESGVKANSKAWKCGEPLYLRLDAYNNGKLCAAHRD